MGCCVGKEAPVVVKNDDDGGSTAPVRKRKCTDVIFLLLFAAALGGVGYVAFFAVQNGDPERYIHGVDSWGNVCGRKSNLPIPASTPPAQNNSANGTTESVKNSGKNRSNHTYELNLLLSDLSILLNPEKMLSSNSTAIVLCVSECPQQEVTQCPDLLTANGYDVDNNVVNRRICQMPGKAVFPHEAILNRCVPKQLTSIGHGLAEASLATAGAMATAIPGNRTVKEKELLKKQHPSKSPVQCVHDIIVSVTDNWTTILYLLLIAFGMSLLTIILLQLFTRVLVVTILIVSVLGTGAVTGYLWYHYLVSIGVLTKNAAFETISNVTAATESILGVQTNLTTDIASTTANLTKALSLDDLHESEWLLPITIVATVFTLLCWIILLWTRKSLKLVISLFDEASVALFSMPSLLLVPIRTMVALAAAFAGFLVVGAFLLSDQDASVDADGIVTFVDRPGLQSGKILFIPVVFVFLWLFEFIFACHEIILAGAISSWFFTRGKEKSKCSCKVCAFVRPTLDLICYNLGTAACGSLIIAIVQFIRLVLAYIQRKLKKVDNKAAKFCLTCLQCCLACFEKILKYINRNAYIVVAMYGEGFCASAKRAVALLVSNAQHVMALNCVSGFCLLLGKITVVAVVGVIGSVWFKSSTVSDMKFLIPMIISCLGAFFIASCFMSVFGMAIDTIFLCFCDDHQRNDGNERPYYSSKNLQKFMDDAKNRKKKKQQQPQGSPGPSGAGLIGSIRARQTRAKRANAYKKPDSPSFTRINIPNRESFWRPSGIRKSKVHPLPPGFGGF